MRAAAAYIAAAPCLHGACVLPLRPTLKKRAVQRKMAGERGLSQSGPSHSYRPLGLVHNLNLGALDGVGARRRRRQQAAAVGGAVVADGRDRLRDELLAGHGGGRGARDRRRDGAQRRHRLLRARGSQAVRPPLVPAHTPCRTSAARQHRAPNISVRSPTLCQPTLPLLGTKTIAQVSCL